MTGPLLTVITLVVMEPVAAAVHRFIGHGIGWSLHRDHHDPGPGLLERNDVIPVVFAALAMAAFALGLSVPGWTPLFWIALGTTLYGLSYALVHDVYIHRRLPLLPRRVRGLEPLRAAHARHHRTGGWPYGVLVPVRARRLAPLAGVALVALGSFALYRGMLPGPALGSGGSRAEQAAANAETLVGLEAALGLDVEASLHRSWLAQGAVGTGLALFYAVAYWPFVAAAAVVAAARHDRRQLGLLASAVAASGLVGLVVITLWPVTPPRLFDAFADPVADLDVVGSLAHPSGLFNPHAALPSFHVTWTVLAAVTLYRVVLSRRAGDRGRPFVVAVIAAVPLVMAVAVLTTANHWVLDVVAGLALATASRAVSHPMHRAFAAARAERHPTGAGARTPPRPRGQTVDPPADRGGGDERRDRGLERSARSG